MVVSLYEFKVHKRIFTHFYHDGMRDLLEEDPVKTFPPGNSFIPENIFLQPFLELIQVLVWSFDRKNFPKDWCVGVLRKRVCHQKGMLPSSCGGSSRQAKRQNIEKVFIKLSEMFYVWMVPIWKRLALMFWCFDGCVDVCKNFGEVVPKKGTQVNISMKEKYPRIVVGFQKQTNKFKKRNNA